QLNERAHTFDGAAAGAAAGPAPLRASSVVAERTTPPALSAMRRDYAHAALSERDVDPDPMRQFERWFAEAREAEVEDANAMMLATATQSGAPSARIVLLRGV